MRFLDPFMPFFCIHVKKKNLIGNNFLNFLQRCKMLLNTPITTYTEGLSQTPVPSPVKALIFLALHKFVTKMTENDISEGFLFYALHKVRVHLM